MTRKLRVLHVIPNFGTGGAERLVIDLMKATDKERFEVAAVSLYSETGTIFEKEIKENGLNIYFLNKHLGLDLRMIPQLYSLFRTLRPDVVHTHLYVLRYALLPAVLCRIPVRVHTLHSVAHKEVDRIGKLVHWLAFNLLGVVPVSISQTVANTAREVYGQGINTPVINNGIPTSRFSSNPGRKTASSRGEVILIHVGRFAPAKNHLLLIKAFALAVREIPAMRLWLVGDGTLRPAVEMAVTKSGIDMHVSFLGEVPDVAELLNASDIFVLSSDWEGFGLVVAEAMAAGKPVITTAVGGVVELVEDGFSGIIVPPRDPEALARAILRLARDPELRNRMGESARRRALERFDISGTARDYEALYQEHLKERGRL